MNLIQLYGRCPSCGQIVELRFDVEVKTTKQDKNGSYTVPCCFKCKDHSPLYVMIPYEIRESKFRETVVWD